MRGLPWLTLEVEGSNQSEQSRRQDVPIMDTRRREEEEEGRRGSPPFLSQGSSAADPARYEPKSEEQ